VTSSFFPAKLARAPASDPDYIRGRMDRLGHEAHTKGRAYATDGIESWSAIRAQGFVRAFSYCFPFDLAFTNLASSSSTRFCQPGPLARKYSTTSGDRRIVMRCFVGDF
jgi:hypothetical protein